ncbi:MAG TPA: hypothetical protein VKM72_20520 [Thermoanaerobaculia bacterium]|nr:hypothetical protein [Thermoanaerobaculia bacterium]
MPLPSRTAALSRAYYRVKDYLISNGFAAEIDWQYEVSLDSLDEQSFLRESAWVILSSGMRESVVRQRFKLVSKEFLFWQSASDIAEQADQCIRRAHPYFRHIGKLEAITRVAERVREEGFTSVKKRIRCMGPDYLRTFPFIGPITSYHLAKNIGFSCAKPDRHLVRIVEALGYEDVDALCSSIQNLTGEPVAVVDLVLWRYAALDHSNVASFVETVRAELM